MIVRVDDFPCGNERGHREFDAVDAILKFVDALGAPFCLGVVMGSEGSGYTTKSEWRMLKDLPMVHLASHGYEHRLLTHESTRTLRELAQFFGPHAVMIPPKNKVTNAVLETLAVAGFEWVCTGPETRRDCHDIDFESTGIREVPSAFYGTAEMFLKEQPELGDWDCLTLHLTWERRGGKGYPGDPDFGMVRELGAQYWTEINSWSDLCKSLG